MKYKQIYLLSFFFVMLLLTSCCKNDSEPPEPPEEPMLTEATMEGKHTLSFLLDGEVWVSDRGWGDLTSLIAIGSKRLAVTAKQSLENDDNIFSFNLNLDDFLPQLYKIFENESNGFYFLENLQLVVVHFIMSMRF